MSSTVQERSRHPSVVDLLSPRDDLGPPEELRLPHPSVIKVRVPRSRRREMLYLVRGWRPVQRVLARSDEFTNVGVNKKVPAITGADYADRYGGTLGTDDTRFRRDTLEAYSTSVVEDAEATEHLAMEVIDRLPSDGLIDFEEALSDPVLQKVFAHIYGYNETDWPYHKSSSEMAFGPVRNRRDGRRAQRTWANEDTYFSRMLRGESGTRGPTFDSSITAKIADVFSSNKYTSQETTRTLATGFNGAVAAKLVLERVFYGLMQNNRSEYTKAVEHPDKIPDVIRAQILQGALFPVGARRITTRPTEIEGHELKAGKAVMVSLFSAVHDPEFIGAEPITSDRSDLKRKVKMAFGPGPHYCTGAELTEMILQRILEPFIRTFPDARLLRIQGYRPGTLEIPRMMVALGKRAN